MASPRILSVGPVRGVRTRRDIHEGPCQLPQILDDLPASGERASGKHRQSADDGSWVSRGTFRGRPMTVL
jgi:hypothetical protein